MLASIKQLSLALSLGSVLLASAVVAKAESESGSELDSKQVGSVSTTAVSPSREVEVHRSFTPHATINARTRKKGKVAFQPTPGTNINTPFLLGSVSLAVLERFEIGTSPLYYAVPMHTGNYSFKWNFYRSEFFDASFGFATSNFEVPTYDGHKEKVTFSGSVLMANVRAPFTRAIMSVALTRAYSAVETNEEIRLKTARYTDEYAVDVSYPVADRIDVTAGVAFSRPYGVSAYEDRAIGYGSTIAYYRPEKFFSKPSFGAHFTPDRSEWTYLFNSRIY